MRWINRSLYFGFRPRPLMELATAVRALELGVPVAQPLGAWIVSAIPTWHSGQAFSTATSAFVAGYSNNAPAIRTGSKSTVAPHAHKTATGQVSLFADPEKAANAFTGPVGFKIGSRNELRGPNYVNFDMGLAKDFPILGDRLKLKFRADAFNVFNHASFNLPSTSKQENDITNSNFGKISSTVPGTDNVTRARVLQGALRLEF